MAARRYGLWLVLAAALGGCAATGPMMHPASVQQNTAVVLAFLDTVYNKHEVQQAFRLYVAPDFTQHRRGAPVGNEAAIQALTHLTHDLYPQLRQDVKRTVAQGDLVAVHSVYIRNPAEKDAHRQAAVDIFRLEHDRIVEHWDVVEDASASSAGDNAVF